MEQWKPVAGFENRYEVSDQGNVRSLNWRNLGIVKNLYLKKHNKGYIKVELARNGKKKTFCVHRLVAEAFIPNEHGYDCINHIDEDKRNNNASNLAWCDRKYNARYSARRHPERFENRVYKLGITRNGVNKNKRIVQMSMDGTVLMVWKDSRDIFLKTGMSDWSISECCRGNRSKAYGFKWQYAVDE